MKKAIFKFNGGDGALLCSRCSVIIKTGYAFTEEEKRAARGEIVIAPQYCKKCQGK
jgi:hypothetical protein